MDNFEQKAFLWEQTKQSLATLQAEVFVLDKQKQKFIAQDKNGNILYRFTPPLLHPIKDCETINAYLKSLTVQSGDFAVVLIQAGAAALGVWEEGECIHHKVITTYMVRKKQGKSQLTYLHEKGKSRMGSRIRLNNTIRFFEDINTKLQEWSEDLDISQKLFFSCTPRIWGEVFRSKVSSPIARDDTRWQRIPLDVNVPNYKELMRVVYRITHGTIETNKEYSSVENFTP